MSVFLLVAAAAVVALLHSILPDHWVPLAVVARTQHWSFLRVGRVTFLASLGHVVASLVLGGILALIGLQFQKQLDTQQGHIIGIVLVLTGCLFLVWDVASGGRQKHGHQHDTNHHHTSESEHAHEHEENHPHKHEHEKQDESREQPLLRRLAAIAVPFGVAASPDLTILPVALAASAIGTTAVVGVLSVFAAVTIVTFISLTLLATLIGYQIKGAWLEKYATIITSLVLIAIGIVAFIGF